MDDTGAACAKAKQSAGKRMYERIVEFGNMESMGKLIFFLLFGMNFFFWLCLQNYMK